MARQCNVGGREKSLGLFHIRPVSSTPCANLKWRRAFFIEPDRSVQSSASLAYLYPIANASGSRYWLTQSHRPGSPQDFLACCLAADTTAQAAIPSKFLPSHSISGCQHRVSHQYQQRAARPRPCPLSADHVVACKVDDRQRVFLL